MYIVVNHSNRHEVAQSIMQHEGLFRISELLDQFKEGLKQRKILSTVQNFPEQFSVLFTFVGSITSDRVTNALCTREFDNTDTMTMGFLHRYIHELSEKGTNNLIHNLDSIQKE